MFGNKKNSDSRRTPRLDGTYNVPRYREYQSPRMRRLMRDEERQKRVRISRNYGLLLVVAIVASTIITGVAGGNAVIQMQKADTIKKQHAPTTLISEGLQNEINRLSAQDNLPGELDSSLQPNGAQVAVSLIDLSDKNRGEVHFNDQTQWTSASTYKLFVALDMSKAVESGRLNWNSPLNGDTMGGCLSQMIHVSDNGCPETWLATYSDYEKLTQTAKNFGSKQTDFNYGNMTTSAGDLANLLKKLYQGELMNSDDTKNLMDLLEHQQYQDGIPDGIQNNINAGKTPQGTLVADKVGFVDDYTGPILNDASIVSSPNGAYVLVVMANGYSWQFISQLTSWIDAQME